MDEDVPRMERNNRKRRKKLLVSARTLFDTQGFEQTTVAQIAKAAHTALRTVYNFFPTKLDILGTLILEEMTDGVAEGQAELGPLPQNPCDGVLRLLEMYARVVARIPRNEGRMFTAHAITTGGATLAGRINATTDKMFHDGILDLLTDYRDRRALPGDMNLDAVARLIFFGASGLYLTWVTDDDMTVDHLLKLLREQVCVVFPPGMNG